MTWLAFIAGVGLGVAAFWLGHYIGRLSAWRDNLHMVDQWADDMERQDWRA